MSKLSQDKRMPSVDDVMRKVRAVGVIPSAWADDIAKIRPLIEQLHTAAVEADTLRSALTELVANTENEFKARIGEPVAYMFQHQETGAITFADVTQVEWGFEKNNPRYINCGALYTIKEK